MKSWRQSLLCFLTAGAVTLWSTTGRSESYTLHLPAGFTLIANQLESGSNGVDEIVSGLPGETQIFKITPRGDYDVFTLDPASGTWDSGPPTLRPGEGFYLWLPSSATLTFTGNRPTPLLPVPLMAGYQLLGRQVPEPAAYEDIVGRPPVNGVMVFRAQPGLANFDTGSPDWMVYVFTNATWTPSVPIANVSEAVWINFPSNTSPPTVTSPADQLVPLGRTATFSVTASGSTPLFYQWRFNGDPLGNGGPISGADTPTLTISNVQPSSQGFYSVTVFNGVGETHSAQAHLAILPPPSIVLHPESQTAPLCTDAQFQVQAVSLEPPSYQWYHNGQIIPNATNPVLVVTNIQPSALAFYYATVSNAAGQVTSQTAELQILLVKGGPVQRGLVAIDDTRGVSFPSGGGRGLAPAGFFPTPWIPLRHGVPCIFTNVNATCAIGEPSHCGECSHSKWAFFDPTNTSTVLVTTEGSDFDTVLDVYTNRAGFLAQVACNNDCGINRFSQIQFSAPQDRTHYIAVDGVGGATGLAQLALLDPISPPSISTPLANLTVVLGRDVLFSIDATGAPPLSYQWRRNGIAIANGNNVSGAMSDRLTISGVQLDQAGDYTVVVTNCVGTVTSAAARLTVVEPPVLMSQPQNQAIALNSTATFTVAVAGTPPFSYQWKREGINLSNGGRIAGATSSILTINNVQIEDAGSYSVEVSNPGASTLSEMVQLTVIQPPEITLPPTSVFALFQASVQFSVAATHDPTFQWLHNGERIPNATGSTLLLNDVQRADVGLYSVVVSNLARIMTSAPVQLQLALTLEAAVGTRLVVQDHVTNHFPHLLPYPTNLCALPVDTPSVPYGVPIYFTTASGTSEQWETNHCGRPASRSQWVRFCSDRNGPLTITTEGSEIDTVLTVYESDDGQNFRFVACNDDDGPRATSRLTLQVATNRLYYVGVDGAAGIVRLQVGAGLLHSPLADLAEGSFRFQMVGLGGQTYVLRGTNDLRAPLANWPILFVTNVPLATIDWIWSFTNRMGTNGIGTNGFFFASPE